MAEFFKNFPEIVYGNKPIKNITVRVDILDDIRDDPYAFLPYTVKDGESAEEIAYLYYGDPLLSWIIFLSNDIIDPYSGWPMDNRDFDATMTKKYEASARAALGTPSKEPISEMEVLMWMTNTGRTDNIVHYRYMLEDDSNIQQIISRDTWLYGPGIVQGDYAAIRLYDYEMEINESKRNIKLLNKQYVETAQENLKSALNG